MRFIYFGCGNEAGHYFWEGRKHIWDNPSPWPRVDGALCPQESDRIYGSRKELPGAALHYKDGWTALAFWDRSVDSRPASNSVFLADATLSFEEMVRLAGEHYPWVVRRLGFTIEPADIEAHA